MLLDLNGATIGLPDERLYEITMRVEARRPLDDGLEDVDVGAELLEGVREGQQSEQAVNVFQCGRCQRMYVVVSFT